MKVWRNNPAGDSTSGFGLAETTRAIVEGGVIPVVVGGNSAQQPDSASWRENSWREKDRAATIEVLAAADRLARLHAPKSPPAFAAEAAVWAARTMQFACQRLVDKVESDTQLPFDLVRGEPGGKSPAEHWSVDLVFRCWWDLMRRCFAANQQDTLNDTLAQVAARWPLAAVGTTVSCAVDRVAVVCEDPCLRIIYVDRVIGRRDDAKAADPLIATQIQSLVTQPLAGPDGRSS